MNIILTAACFIAFFCVYTIISIYVIEIGHELISELINHENKKSVDCIILGFLTLIVIPPFFIICGRLYQSGAWTETIPTHLNPSDPRYHEYRQRLEEERRLMVRNTKLDHLKDGTILYVKINKMYTEEETDLQVKGKPYFEFGTLSIDSFTHLKYIIVNYQVNNQGVGALYEDSLVQVIKDDLGAIDNHRLVQIKLIRFNWLLSDLPGYIPGPDIKSASIFKVPRCYLGF